MVGSSHSVSVESLRSLVKSLSASVDDYESATTKVQGLSALDSIAKTSQYLKDVTIDPGDRFSEFTLRPLANSCVRVALSMKLFDHLPKPGDAKGVSAEELARLTETDADLTSRVLRGLVAFNLIDQDNETGTYTHTPTSLFYADPAPRAWAVWVWDVMVRSATLGIGPYFDDHARPLRNPTEARNCPFTLAHGMADMDIFAVIRKIGKDDIFSRAMSGSSAQCARESVSSYDFAGLRPGDDNVLLVDVGGAKGQTILEIQRANPSLKGRMILQDLPSMLDGGIVDKLDAELVPYNFFEEVQPIKGAGAYFLQRIFHDWSDEDSKKILSNLRPAMGKESKLIICDVVIQEEAPHPTKILRDMNMMIIGGMERSQQQWHDLLSSQGFQIEGFYGLHNPDNSIIEARIA